MNATPLASATILVPVAFDDASKRAVATAVTLARVLRGQIVILHVVPPTSFPEGTRVLPVGASDPVNLEEYVSQHARRLLDEHFTAGLLGGVPVRKEARAGHPVETILRAVDECDAKLVVVGTHGRSGLERFVLGSVAEGLLRVSPVPVMVVRAPDVVSETAHEHGLAAAGIASGVVAGVAVGAIAGPVGAVAGGAIGSVVGAIAGTVMAREDAREVAHDRELDDAIGVTHGSLGTPPKTKKPSKAVLAEAEAEGDSKGVETARSGSV